MKKILESLLKGLFLSGIIVLVNYISQTDNFYEVLDQKIIPVVVAVIGATGSLFSVIKPVINKLSKKNTDMEKALNDLKGYIEENNMLKKTLEETFTYTKALQKDIESITEMLKIGFSQNEEFVKKGKANKICRCVNDKKDSQ